VVGIILALLDVEHLLEFIVIVLVLSDVLEGDAPPHLPLPELFFMEVFNLLDGWVILLAFAGIFHVDPSNEFLENWHVASWFKVERLLVHVLNGGPNIRLLVLALLQRINLHQLIV